MANNNHGQGDSTAQNDDYIIPCGSSFGFQTWKNQLISKRVQKIKAQKVSLMCQIPAVPIIVCGDGSVYLDDFSAINPVYWTETDPWNFVAPGPNGWEHIIHHAVPGVRQGDLDSNFDLGGDFDVCYEIDIYDGNSSGSYFYIRMTEQVKGGADVYFYLYGDGHFSLTDYGSFGSFSFPSTHNIRFVRSGTTVTVSMWNPSTEQWEIDGTPGGFTLPGTWDLNPHITLKWSDNDGDTLWIEGSLVSFSVNAGTLV